MSAFERGRIEFENGSSISIDTPRAGKLRRMNFDNLSGLGYDIHFAGTPKFDGATIDHERDHARLVSQYDKVFRAMRDGHWRTPAEIERLTGYSWASISARLRDMRKEKFGGHKINREYVGNGLYMYQLIVQPQQMRLV